MDRRWRRSKHDSLVDGAYVCVRDCRGVLRRHGFITEAHGLCLTVVLRQLVIRDWISNSLSRGMCPDRADDGGVCVARENAVSGATLTEGRFSADDEQFHPRQTGDEPCNTAAQVRNLLAETVRGSDQEAETDSSAGRVAEFCACCATNLAPTIIDVLVPV
ncbi:hypothetical protein F1559_002343 [Cyanidiococcus yangmingshanensis]|uniref:Uncharacterized protein n=1 Tax=Cyanidiococcus yangmingshanensis TaxID=2690220 RepID=A0A7J7IFI7_9RHOD|nr:hypothetical protein F1559_002343 [Cyanidiococcus yangmingshanensis]